MVILFLDLLSRQPVVQRAGDNSFFFFYQNEIDILQVIISNLCT